MGESGVLEAAGKLGAAAKRGLFSPSVSCADSSLVRGSEGRGVQGTNSRDGAAVGAGAVGKLEMAAKRELFSPSVGCADSFLVRGSERAQVQAAGGGWCGSGGGERQKTRSGENIVFDTLGGCLKDCRGEG